MATLAEISQEKQRVSERLARLDAERSKLAEQLNELEIAERVLSRFGGAAPGEGRRRGRAGQAEAAPKAPAPRRARARTRAQAAPQGPSLSETALQAVGANPHGVTSGELLDLLERDYGLKVRPNHLGIALQRHRRGGRLEMREGRWFVPQQADADPERAPREAFGG